MNEARVGSGVLAAVDAALARCHDLAGRAEVGSRLASTRALADLVPAMQVTQARVLASLDVHPIPQHLRSDEQDPLPRWGRPRSGSRTNVIITGAR